MRAADRLRTDDREVPDVPSPDRRAVRRGTVEGGPNRRHLVSMIVGTYREMPGLCLQLKQAARLFELRPTTCQIVLDDLVRNGQLRRTADGQYTSV